MPHFTRFPATPALLLDAMRQVTDFPRPLAQAPTPRHEGPVASYTFAVERRTQTAAGEGASGALFHGTDGATEERRPAGTWRAAVLGPTITPRLNVGAIYHAVLHTPRGDRHHPSG